MVTTSISLLSFKGKQQQRQIHVITRRRQEVAANEANAMPRKLF
jgi:hypothetical protein